MASLLMVEMAWLSFFFIFVSNAPSCCYGCAPYLYSTFNDSETGSSCPSDLTSNDSATPPSSDSKTDVKSNSTSDSASSNQWLERMAGHVGRHTAQLTHLGDEWSDDFSLRQSLEEFLMPYLSETSHVAEIGVGGGRIASRVYSHVKSLHCFGMMFLFVLLLL